MIFLESETSFCLLPDGDTVSVQMDGNRILYESSKLIVNGREVQAEIRMSERKKSLCFVIGRKKYVLSIDRGKAESSFIKYELQKHISIGGSIEDDIYLRDETAARSQLLIDTEAHTICDTGGMHHVWCEGKRVETGKYRPGDTFYYACLTFILMDHCIAIENAEHVYISLSRFHKDEEVLKPRVTVWQNSELPILPSLNPSFTLHYPPPSPVVNEQTLVMIGPALTMTASSCGISLLMAYNSYMSGREISSFMPMLLFPAMMFSSTLFWYLIRKYLARKQKKENREKRIAAFARQLSQIEKERGKLLQQYETITAQKFADPAVLMENWKKAEMKVMDRYDPDFLSLYIGRGKRRIVLHVKTEGRSGEEEELNESFDASMKRMKQECELPLILSLKKTPHIWVHDESEDRGFSQYLLLQLISLYKADDLLLVFIQENHVPVHLYSLAHTAGKAGCSIYTPGQFREVKDVLKNEKTRDIVYICSEGNMEKEFAANDMVLFLSDTYCTADVSLEVRDKEGICRNAAEKEKYFFVPACLKKREYPKALAQAAISSYPGIHAGSYGFMEVNGYHSLAQMDPLRAWQKSCCISHLKCVLGVDDTGKQIELDLHEHGDGPHGLIAGTTGSGKSECIISMILSLACRYSPADLQIVLIDFKGTGLLQALSEKKKSLPHLAGTLSNLDSQDAERVLVSLKKECQYREKLFARMHASAGHDIASIDVYDTSWQKDSGLPYLAHLLIVIDEFAQLKKENPLFMDELVSIARVGRSLGIHLLLSTQKPAGVVNGQIASNTRYKICLKVNDSEDSRDVINDISASRIQQPGEFYVSVDGTLRHGYSGYSGRCYVPGEKQIEIWDQNSQHLHQPMAEGPSERQCIVHALLSLKTDDMQVRPLWPERISSITWAQLRSIPEALGIIDDFHDGCYRPLISSSKLLLLSDDAQKTKDFLFSCLYQKLKENREIYILSDDPVYDPLVSHPGISAVISCTDDDRIDWLKQRIRKHHSSVILIDDTASFLGDREERIQLFQEWCRKEENELCLFCVIHLNHDLSHRLSVLFPMKLVLSCLNEREISDFFEKACRCSFTEDHAFLLYENGHILRGVYPGVNETELYARKGRNTYVMPALPKLLKPDESGYLGIYTDDLSRFVLEEGRQTIIMAQYDVTLLGLYEYLKKRKSCVFSYEGTDSDAEVIFTLSDAYERGPLRRKKDVLILYAGSGFRHQYTLKAYLPRDLKENEGIVFNHGRSRKIRLIDV